MATVNKNFKVKNGLVVEGTTATVNGKNILTESQDSQDFIIGIIGGSATPDNTPDTVVLRDEFGNFAAGEITASLQGNVTGDVTGTVSDISNHNTDGLSEGATNLYFTNQRALDATSAAYDVAGSAATAESNANTYTDGRETAITTAYQSYADTAEADAVTSANAYTDGRETAITTAYQSYADTAEQDAKDYADAAVASLVDSAPATLDTLNELAAALQDNPDVISDLQTIAAGKQDTLTAGANIDITGATISVTGLDTDDVVEGTNLYFTNQRALDATSAAYDVAGAAADAQSNAETFATDAINALDTDDIEEGITNLYHTDARAKTSAADLLTSASLTNITITGTGAGLTITAENGVADSTTDDLAEGETNLYYTDSRVSVALADGTLSGNLVTVSINSISNIVSASSTVETASQVSAYEWQVDNYKSAEFLVKVAHGSHTEISKVLLTIDASNNVAITEYGTVGTNGSLMTVTADTYSPGMGGVWARLRVTTINNDSTVTVMGTLIA
jgi:hypothetical protein